MTDHADALYQPLVAPDRWQEASYAVDGSQWQAGIERMAALGEEAPAWADMVGRGMVLMAAYRSGAMAGLYGGDEAVALSLLVGTGTPSGCGPVAGPHVMANHAAVLIALAGAAGPASSPAGAVSEQWVRRIHAVGCGPQVTHPVATDHGVHDHVLGHGDYKHHPNHVRTDAGGWRALVPVAGIGEEMANLVGWLASPAYAALHPVARAAYVLYALHHVGPFAAGNGRVARAMASGQLLAAGSVPLVVPTGETVAYRGGLDTADDGAPGRLVRFVERRCANLVGLVSALNDRPAGREEDASLDRWRARVRAAHRLQAMLPAAVEGALLRHRRRTDLGWMADLAAAAVECTGSGNDGPRFDVAPLSIRVPLAGGTVVEELLVVDPHPVVGEGDVVVLRAPEAEVEIEVRPEEVASPSELGGRVHELLERTVTALAVRAAALDDD